MSKPSILAVTGLLAASLSATAVSAETLIVAHGFAPNHSLAERGIMPWMACVEEKTSGAISFNHFPSGQISSHPAAVDSLNNGIAQVSAIIIAYASDKLPLNGITLLPDMGTTAAEMVAAWRKSLQAGNPLADELAANKVHPLLLNLLPAYQIMSTVGPIDTLEKFKGLKTRVGGGSTTLMASALGATPVEISASDMYLAMQRRTVDATFLTLSSAKPYSLPELVNAMSSNGSFGSGGTVLAIDQATYDGLSPEHRKALDDCGRQAENELTEYVDTANEALKSEFASMGINVYEFSDETLANISESMASVGTDYVARLEKRGLPAREVYDAYREALGK